MDNQAIKRYEGKIRHFLYYFCSYVLLHSFFISSLTSLKGMQFLLIPFLIIGSFPITQLARHVFRMILEENEWDSKKGLTEYKLLFHIVKTISLFVFYFYLQVGVSAVFFPSLVDKMIHNVPFYLPFFISNCFLVYLFYNKYIFEK